VRNPLRKALIGAAAVAAMSALAVVPASAGTSSTQGDTGRTFPTYDSCQDVADTIIDGQTGAECIFQYPLWHLYTYG
jgi:hypothetical protein